MMKIWIFLENVSFNMSSNKIQVTYNQYIIIFSILNAILFSKPFFSYLWLLRKNILIELGFYTFAFFVSNVVFSILFTKKTLKPASLAIIFINSIALYFMNKYNIQIDVSMVINIFETNFGEAKDLLSLQLFLYIFLFGFIPIVSILKYVQVDYRNNSLLKRLKFFLVNLTFSLIIAYSSTKIDRVYKFLRNENRFTVNYYLPVNYIGNIVAAIVLKIYNSIPQKVIELDVQQKIKHNKRNNIIVFILGESARSQNFSLNGYGRNTNEPLESYDMISFRNVYSCAVSTTMSIPCIFSHLGRSEFDKAKAKNYENLLDIFSKIGYNVKWLSNNGGCKDVCNRIKYSSVSGLSKNRYDDSLTKGLIREIKHIKNRNNFLVLNQIGSHHTYHKRYPETFDVFKPSCKKPMSDCKYEELVNTYDNTILYTSKNIKDIIDILMANFKESNIFVIYVSDHGDGLGESRIFAHGMPYSEATDYVKKVPLLLWFSDNFVDEFKIDKKCLTNKINDNLSHDNIFHSMLGLFDIENEYYDENLDIFRSCRYGQ